MAVPGSRRLWLGALAAGLPLAFGGGALLAKRTNKVSLPDYAARDLRSRLIVVTGGTSGIGNATCIELVRSGACVVIGSRNAARGAATAEQLSAEAARVAQCEGSVIVLPLDVSSPQSTLAFVDAVDAIDAERGRAGVDAVLLAAAEIPTKEGGKTADGVDTAFATNHLGAHMLVKALEPALRRGGTRETGRRARLVIVGSRLEAHASPDLAELAASGGARFIAVRDQGAAAAAAAASTSDGAATNKREKTPFDPMLHYAATKRCNMALALSAHCAWRDARAPIELVTVTPGMVNTALWRHYAGWFRLLTSPVRAAFLRTPSEAAAGVVYALVAAELPRSAAKDSTGAADAPLYLSDAVAIEQSEGGRDVAFAAALSAVCDDIALRTTGC